jgi:hypothetical protein
MSTNDLFSNTNINASKEPDGFKMDELSLLKQRANMMNITYSNNIGVEALKEKINKALTPPSKEEEKEEEEESENEVQVTDNSVKIENTSPKVKKLNLREKLIRDKMKLVRVRIGNLDPRKKDLPGEIITVSNHYIGTVRKFIPFGQFTDNGYHIPKIIYDTLREKTFLSIRTRKGPNGETIVEHNINKEYTLEILPPLTEDELKKLAAAQSASNSVN